tara:strand:+ start:452 stop:682 length:231 start_codon:yes stop_codon:yes gene_type:complete
MHNKGFTSFSTHLDLVLLIDSTPLLPFSPTPSDVREGNSALYSARDFSVREEEVHLDDLLEVSGSDIINVGGKRFL